MSRTRSDEPLPDGRFDVEHYRALHHHLFQDVYDWAGEFRTVELMRGTSRFAAPAYIEQELERCLDALGREQWLTSCPPDDFSSRAAFYLGELNAIHPFRDGNGRTLFVFFVMLAENAGYQVERERFDRNVLLPAMVRSFHGQYEDLEAWVSGAISPAQT